MTGRGASIETDSQTVHTAIERLQRLTELFAARRSQLAKRVGLTEQQWQVLEEISTEHFMPSMFARRNDSTPAAVSKVLRQLLDKELITVSVSESDGRQREYELAAAGKRVILALRDYRRRAIAHIWHDLPRQELKTFLSLSERLIAKIEHYATLETD